MNRRLKLLCLCLIATSLIPLSGCGRRYAKGKYIDPNTIILRSDKFVEADLQEISNHFSKAIGESSFGTGAAPVVLFAPLTNSTDEHIDMQSLADKLQVSLFKAGKFRFVNAKMRDRVLDEYNYEQSGHVAPETAKKLGRQTGAQYMLSGAISSIKQPVGRQEIVYYKMTLEMTDFETNVIEWTDDVEIKKQFRKRFTGF